jgi:hypothetical protein
MKSTVWFSNVKEWMKINLLVLKGEPKIAKSRSENERNQVGE